MATNEDVESEFEAAGSNASLTYPTLASSIRKNGHLMIKGRPCKVVEMSTAKTGKHGHAKIHFVALDVLNGKKLEDIVPSTHNVDVPVMKRVEYMLMDVNEEGFCSLLLPAGDTKDDIRIKLKSDSSDAVHSQIWDLFEKGKHLTVTVLECCDQEKVVAVKENPM